MITYDYYRIFYFVAQYHSFTKAAEVLGNNQPNITRCMNNLEHELNCKLFVRSNRGVTLTPEGTRLYEHAAIAYEQLLVGEEELKKDRELESGLITIGASETALRLVLLDKLEVFRERYPHVRLRILNYSTPQAITALENGLADLAIVTTPLTLKNSLQKVPLYSFHEILLGGKKFASAAADKRHLADFGDAPFISLGNDTGTRQLHIQYFVNYGLPFQPDMEAATTDQILPMIAHNLGIGFYPEKLAQESIAKGEVCQISITEPLPDRCVCLLCDKNRPLSIAAKKLKEELMR